MANLTDLSNKRAELITAIDNYQTAVAGGVLATITAAKDAASLIGRDYAVLVAQVKKDNPAYNDELFSAPAKMIQSIRDDISIIMTTGVGIVNGLKMLMDTEFNGLSPGGLSLSINAGVGSNLIINWGDGTIETQDTSVATMTHVYDTPGLYDVILSGTRVIGGGIGSATAIVDVKQWGQDFINNDYTSFFYTARFMTMSAIDAPNFQPGTSCEFMFRGCTIFNDNIGHWDTSNVINMKQMFFDANAFNRPIETWNVSNVTNMQGMFQNASAFNQPLNNWDVNHYINMKYMFSRAIAFNGAVDQWIIDPSSNMDQTFAYSNINQNLSHWSASVYQPNIWNNTPMERTWAYHPAA